MLADRYRPTLYMQHFLLLVDLLLNSFSTLARTNDAQNTILLVLYVIQDVCILFSIILIFLVFFNTYIFQAGLVSILIDKFKFTILSVFIYLGITIGLHVWTITTLWNNPNAYIYSPGYIVLFVFQRVGAVLYYYTFKRTVLILSNPKFYENSAWLREEFDKKH